MSLTAGIVGLPNVGKSTLFNAITKKNILIANYPFATIDPNVGVVTVPDNRLKILNEMYNPKKLIETTFEFTDIAGLVKGASKGEGLGNKFLSHIREVDAICEVVRCFDDQNIIHVEGSTDPLRDVETIDIELIFSDLEVIDSRLLKIEKKAMATKDKISIKEVELLRNLKDNLEHNIPIRKIQLNAEDSKFIKSFNLLTAKPIIYIANIKDEDLNKENSHVKALREYVKDEDAEVVVMCAKIESELSELNDEDKTKFLNEIGIEESGLDKLIKSTYSLLGLATFFTVGSDEVRAWTFKNGMTAPECAGIIHTDFERGFIRAEIMSYEDLITHKTELKTKEAGKTRLEGKDYKMRDGDICNFRFNV